MNALAKAAKPLLSWCCGSGICGSRFIDWDEDEVNHTPVRESGIRFCRCKNGCGFVDAGSVERVAYAAKGFNSPLYPRCLPEQTRRVRAAHRTGIRCGQTRGGDGFSAVTIDRIATRSSLSCSTIGGRPCVEAGAVRSPNNTFILPKSFLGITWSIGLLRRTYLSSSFRYLSNCAM